VALENASRIAINRVVLAALDEIDVALASA
jgi:hypothetical protein